VYRNYSAILIEPVPEKRLRLRLVAEAAPCFSRVEPCSSFSEALAKIDTDKVDVVFIGDVDLEKSKGFIESSKKTNGARLSAFVFLRQDKEKNEGNTALNILYGADSILYSPFSVDDLVATTKIAEAISKADNDARNKAAMDLLIGSVMSEVDQIGEANSQSEENVSSPKLGKLRQLGEQLKQATVATSVDYFGVISKAFIEAVPPVDRKSKQGYGGVSARVQRLLDAKKAKLKSDSPS
jgi:hypothetical protein